MGGSDTPQVDNADDKRMFRCARNEFDLDVSPNAGKSLSRLVDVITPGSNATRINHPGVIHVPTPVNLDPT